MDGDVLLTGPEAGFTVVDLVPGRYLVLLIRESDADISIVLALTPLDEQCARLVIRLWASFRGLRGGLFGLLFDPGDFVMMRKMLLGIKERAEHLFFSQREDDQGDFQ